MKTKVKRLSKRTLAMFLGIIMLITSMGIGSFITANAANITSDGNALLFFKMNAVSWWNSGTNGNQNFAYFYGTSGSAWSAHSVQQTGNYYYVKIPSGTWDHVILTRNSVTSSPSWDNKYNQTGDIALESGKNYISAFSEKSATATFSTYQVDSTASLAASSTSITTAESSTLTPSLSTNTDYNDIKSTSYSVTTNPGSAGSVTSAGVFSATAAGTYTVTATVTYNAKGFTGITKTATASKDITVTAATVPGITSIAPASTSLNIGETTSITTVLANTSSPTVTYSSSDATVLSVTKDSNTSATVKALKPGSATITALLSDSGTTATKTTSSITVKTPAVSTFSYSPNTIYTGGATATPTVSMNTSNQNSSSTVSYAYSITNATSYASINATTGVITSKTTAGTVTAKVTATVTYNGISYDATKTVSVTVKKPNDVYIYGDQFGGWSWESSSPSATIKKMTYDVTEGAYYYDATITSENNYFRFWDDTDNDKHYKPSSNTQLVKNGTKVDATSDGNWDAASYYTSGETGTLRFWFSLTDKKAWVTGEATHSVTVTSTNGTVKKGTNAITSGSTTSVGEETASEFTATPATGYKFDGWTLGTGIENKSASTSANPISIVTKSSGNYTLTANYSEVTYTTLTAVGKYSTDGSTYNTAMSTNPTISNTSGTYKTGVTVTAPDVDGYQFVDWYTANGTFANSADKQTTFKPNANSAQAVARYKKIFTITSSVDSTGTGAGTVTTSKTSVEAGGSYTITATPKSGSAIESIKVNNGTGTTTSPRTVSSVSANQTVVVKFKSNVYLKGTMNATAWAGDAMKANSAGTSYTIANVVLNAGTTYEFKHWVDSGDKGTYSITVGTWALNNIATHSTKADGYGGTNLTITPSVKAKVTFVSDGTKFTSITAIPYDSTTYDVTLTQSADYTITSTYMGVEYTTAGKNANVTVPVYSGTGFSYTVTPASGKYLSGVAQSKSVALSPAFSATTHANSYTGTVSSVSNAFAVSATAASKLNVVAKTNKSARGTVTVNTSTAAPGESITITVSPKNGVLKSLTCTYANGAVYTCNLSTKAWTRTTAANNNGAQAQRSVDGMAAFAFRDKVSKLMTSATAKLFSGADTTYPMTLAENSAATINATFDAYSAESNYYYNGYDTSGSGLSGYYDKRMTEVMLNGVPYSYYEVSGRSGGDQLMTVSKKSSTGNTGYAYFTRPSNWGSGWSNSKAPYAYFFNDSGQVGANYPGTMMTFVTGTEHNFKIAIPDGATKVIFSDSESGGSGAQTVDITMTSSTSAYYLNGGYQDIDGVRKYEVTAWSDQPSDAGIQTTTTEYWYNANDRYYGYVDGFNNSNNSWMERNAGSHSSDGNRFAKPNENTGDNSYYVMVFYAGNTYTNGNGTLNLTGSANHDVVMWSYELPSGSDDENVTIYAKDGAIRNETSGVTYANIADTKIYLNNETVGTKHNGKITNQTYETYKAAKGDTIVIKTQIGATDSGTLSNATALKNKYYVRGFCVNGEVSVLLEPNDTGVYTLTYKVPEDEDLSKIEITPIYYLNDTEHNPIVTYRVTGFTDELKAVGSGKPNWGDTLYTYPFYGTLGGQNNAFGAYPGQPMVYYKGQYQMQIPQKDTAWDPYAGTDATTLANTSVSGITMSNGYYDLVHRQIMGYGDDSTSADHVQTYDYGDFYKIFNEKKPVDNIVFDFKYKTKKHNLTDIITSKTTASALTSKYGDTNGNGFEPLTNFHGRAVDLFGTPLSGDAADTSKTKPLYVVSMGGVDGSKGVENIAGYYATEWNVYAPSTKSGTPANSDVYSRVSGGDKTSIPPEVLVLNDDDNTSFNTTTYPSAVAEGTGAYNYQVTDWKTLYHSLESYRGIPVLISYEKASMQVGEKNHTTSGSGGATRNDGRWLYSKNGENITGKIKIQYSNDTGETYVDNPASGETGYVDGLSAYFTNDGVEGQMTFATTIDPDKTFDFEAKTTNANYKFVGWFMEDGTKITTDNASHTERSGSYTFVAKFMQVTSGQLILSHSADKGTINSTDYQGAGTAKIGVVVKNGDEVVRTYDLTTSDITLDDKIIKSDNSNYTIEVTLKATATGDDTYGTTVLANPSGENAKFYKNPTTTTVDKTNTIVLDSFTVGDLFTNGTTQNVKNIIYHSYFTQAVFNYKFKFTFKDRFGKDKTYYRIGKLTSAQASNENYVYTDNSNKKYLKPDFYSKLAPHESNFGKNFSWGDMSANKPFNNSGNVWTCEATITSTQTDNNVRTATFKLPYAHTDGVPSNLNIMDKAESVNYVMNNITYGSVVKKDVEDYITAPRQLKDGSTIKNFQYWSIASTSNTKKEVARCYFYSFNFVAYDNYEITPVYDTGATPLNNGSGDTPVTSISYLSTTRNQYNGNGTDTAPVDKNAEDLLFNDFVMSFDYKGFELYKNDDTSAEVSQIGYVVERVQKLEVQQDGTPYVDPNHYSEKSISAKTESEIKDMITNADNSKFAVSSGTLTRYKLDKDDLDNKNRVEFYEAYYNSKGWNTETQKPAKTAGYKNYVYKAYTYMVINGTVTLSAPAYFTMYEEATK